MKSLRKQVFEYRDRNPDHPYKKGKKSFSTMAETSFHTYWYSWKSKTINDITSNLIITDFDTIKESELAYQQGNYKGVEALHKIHQMKLKPIVIKSEKSLQEIFSEL